MDAVTVFNFQDRHEVRTIIDADGHPLFCGKDVCEILGVRKRLVFSQSLICIV